MTSSPKYVQKFHWSYSGSVFTSRFSHTFPQQRFGLGGLNIVHPLFHGTSPISIDRHSMSLMERKCMVLRRMEYVNRRGLRKSHGPPLESNH
jgi:hypothetical protein